MEPDSVEIRVLGCLIEKQRTTPAAYPLTLNSLRLACNQSTNRDPVLELEEGEIRGALERLGQRKWTRLASWSSGRSMKYRHMLGEALDLGDAELSLLSVLMLRGPQTPGELRQRTERQHSFGDEDLAAALAGLQQRELVRVLPRQPGQREQRYEQLLGEAPAAPVSTDQGEDRIAALESELAALRDEVRALREELRA
ncbi:MAG TPA: YceH family protein [Thermoleophilaceae bacterium]|nr:YceH family protein [Thermoleophilaceae bacterium]